ncbi:RNB domain-containing ribonuclease (plasmid) [Trichlorobacter lovleyi]|uniref:ribonuclease R family protein n=1 Tax=Trichlorobacter lovleyi TaxID=313985 RepID=UPI002240A71A|nr:RNB domain-containing ribonuclease [Trichlorobacter lovleyi]QOX80793.1 RNB domain-containing ribonuclease [Trichlorobacter lovleyi]
MRKKTSLNYLAERLAAHIVINAPSGLTLEGLSCSISCSHELSGLTKDHTALLNCLKLAEQKGFVEVTKTEGGDFIVPALDLLEDARIDDEDSYEDPLPSDDFDEVSCSYTTTGLLHITPNGYGFVSRRVGSDILIPHSGLADAITGDLVRINVFDDGDFEVTGEIVEIVTPAEPIFVGILSSPEKSSGMHKLLPFMSQICGRGVFVGQSRNHDLSGSLARVEIIKRPDGPGKGIVGKAVDLCTSPELPEHASKAVCVEFGLQTTQTESAAIEAKQVGAGLYIGPSVERINLSGLPFITIDGEASRDFDDAVYLSKDSNGDWQLKVAIADVSHFVMPGSALDKHAYERGTSIYFPDQCIPMLPEELSNGACSLVEGEERLVLVAEMIIGLDGSIISYDFYRGSIISQRRLTYQQAERMITGHNQDHLSDMLREMNSCRIVLNQKRLEEGALVFFVDEIDLAEDDDSLVYRKSASSTARLRSQMLIEEFMLAANQSAARFISKKLIKQPVLLRTHEEPDVETIRGLAKYANIEASGKSSRQIIQEITSMPRSYASDIFMNKAIRCMKKARYSAVDGGTGEQHFSLATKFYTHFTSPIRRYPDILVHRAITQILDGTPDASQPEKHLAEFAQHCSNKELCATKAERAYLKRISARTAVGLIGNQVPGVVSGLSKRGIYVEIGESKIEGVVSSKTLRGRFDKPTCTYHLFKMKGVANTPRTIRLGAVIDVVVESVNELYRTINLKIV